MTAIPKPRPRLLEKRDRASATAAIDRAERAKCRQRSGGRCEVGWREVTTDGYDVYQCTLRATDNHHLISGSGRRGRGKSILAAHRIDVCRQCHQDITGHVLVPVGLGREDAATVRYERVR